MRIAFVFSCLEPYGGHIAVLELGNRLVDHGHDVTIIHPRRSILSRRNRVLRRADRMLPGSLLKPAYREEHADLGWFDFAGALLEVPDLEDRHLPEFDAVFATAWQTAEWVARFQPRTGRRFYLIQHYEVFTGPRHRVDATWRGPFVHVVTSEWLRTLGRRRFGLEPIHIVPQGVDPASFWPERGGAGDHACPRVGFLYHPAQWKGVRDAVQALESCAREAPLQPVAFGVLPPGPELPPGTEYHLRPSRAELRRIYSSLDVFVCGSWSESGPLTVPEAMACGACVVSTEVGNVSLWTSHGDGAFLAPPRRPDALAKALAAALDDDEERRARAARGRQLIQEFTWERSARALERIIEQNCRSRGVLDRPRELVAARGMK